MPHAGENFLKATKRQTLHLASGGASQRRVSTRVALVLRPSTTNKTQIFTMIRAYLFITASLLGVAFPAPAPAPGPSTFYQRPLNSDCAINIASNVSVSSGGRINYFPSQFYIQGSTSGPSDQVTVRISETTVLVQPDLLLNFFPNRGYMTLYRRIQRSVAIGSIVLQKSYPLQLCYLLSCDLEVAGDFLGV